MYEHREGLIVQIQINVGNISKSITIGNIYRPPRTSNDNLNAFINEFSSIVSLLEHNCKNTVIIAGDFNINLLKLNENDLYSSYFDFLKGPKREKLHAMHVKELIKTNYFER